MSRSEVFRSASLSAELRAELGRLSRGGRLQQALPALRAHLRQTLEDEATLTALTPAQAHDLDRRLDECRSLEDVRSVATMLGNRALSAMPEGGHGRSLAPETLTPSTDPSRRTTSDSRGASLELLALGLDRAGLASAFVEHSLDSAELDEVRDILERATTLHGQGEARDRDELMSRARQMLASADEEVTAARAGEECRDRLASAAASALEEMGYLVETSITDGSQALLVGHATDGRQAVLNVAGPADAVEVTSTFTDPGHAVHPGHPSAAATCDPAVADQEFLHAQIKRDPGLKLGAPTKAGPPTRDSAPVRRYSRPGHRARSTRNTTSRRRFR